MSDKNPLLKASSKSGSTDSKSSQKSSSQTSLGMGRSLRMSSTDIRELTRETQSIGFSSRKLTAEGGVPPGESVFDTIAYIIFCAEHKKVVVRSSDKDQITWLPFIAAPQNRTWRDASKDGVSIIFNKQDSELDAKLGTKIPIKERKCLHVFRTQMPNKQQFINSVIELVVLENNPKIFKCCQNTKRIRWLPLKDCMDGNIENVWGPEVQNFSKCAKNVKPTGLTEQSLEKAYFYIPKGEPKSAEEHLIKGIGIGEFEVEKLYVDYIEHSFPSISMSLYSFKVYITKYLENNDKNDERLPRLYNAYNYKKNNCINFHEFILGVASMEPKAPHGEARVKFLFRYYDVDGDGKLSESEFKKFIKDINVGSDETKIDAKTKEAMGGQSAIDLESFIEKVLKNKTIRGTSGLCRSSKSVFRKITETTNTREEKKSAVKKKAGFLMQNRRNKGICFACRGKKYDYGLHAIKLDTIGRCVEPRRIFEPETVSDKMTAQKYSMEYTFNTRSIAHSFIDLIRGFSRKKGQSNEARGFMAGDRETLYNYLQVLGRDLGNILAAEDRVIKVNSPAYVFGDILGNLDDLLQFEKLLWQPFPIVSAHYIFLGNYVNKGNWSIECAIYLFALKLIAPMKFILLRGSNESRAAQKDGFQKECETKYGTDGYKIWELINSVFDKMPVCAIIDEQLFCTHSGVPITASNVEDINNVPVDLKDPTKNVTVNEILNCEPKEAEVKKFLKSFGLSHVIRSNSLTTASGYDIQFNGKMLTIFSSSKFGRNNNEAVTAFLEDYRIRIIRLDTTKSNQSKVEPKPKGPKQKS